MKELQLEGVKNIILDLGGVLVNLDFNRLYKGFWELGIDPHSNEANDFILQFETGRLDTAGFIERIQAAASRNVSDEELVRLWNSLLCDFPAERIRLLSQLRLSYRMFLLSNTNELHINRFERICRRSLDGIMFEDLFEKIYYSSRVGLRKPDREIFELLLTENNLVAEETLFIDDTLEHVRSAESLGIRAYHLDLSSGEQITDLVAFN